MAASSSSHPPVSGSPFFLDPLEIHDNVLYLLGTKGKSITYCIAIRNFDERSPDPQEFVPLNGRITPDGAKFYINVAMAAIKLNLSEAKVVEIAGRDDAIELFRRAAAIHQFITTSKIEAKHQKKLAEKYLNSEIKSFKIKGKRSLLQSLRGRKVVDQRFFFDTKEFKLYNAEFIAEGTRSKVFKISTLIGPELSQNSPPAALKKVRSKNWFQTDILAIAMRDLKNESEILKTIHSSGELLGIQPPPTFTTDIAYTTRLYVSNLTNMSNLKEFKNMDSKDKLKLMGQLLIGLGALHESGYFHGDIKPLNCLFEKDKSSSEQKISKVVLSDFGGAKEARAWREQATSLPYSPHYLAPELGGGTFEKKDLTPYTVEQLQSNDVFALSKTILEVLLDDLIYGTISEKQFEILTKKIRIPIPLAEALLEGMRNPIANGLTAAQFLKNFNEAFREVYGEDIL